MEYFRLRNYYAALAFAATSLGMAALPPAAQAMKENTRILMIWGGEIAHWKVSTHYHATLHGPAYGVDQIAEQFNPLADDYVRIPSRRICPVFNDQYQDFPGKRSAGGFSRD